MISTVLSRVVVLTEISIHVDPLGSLDRNHGAISLPLLRSGSDYRNSIGKKVITKDVLEGSLFPQPLNISLPLHFSAALRPTVGSGHFEVASPTGNSSASGVPLLRVKSICVGELSSELLAEVKDVLIPPERILTHDDQVIGKGVAWQG